jgi:POT family proton-dependent oligopeptide transporter
MDQQPRPTTPKGVAYLAFTEMWERFSFYGMQAILLLYMVDQTLTPGHIETLLGMGGFRHGLEAVFGPMTTQALAYQIFGLYGGLVYLTPIIGGWLGDNVIGQTQAVILGGVLMMAGHLLMALESALLPALLLFLKPLTCMPFTPHSQRKCTTASIA